MSSDPLARRLLDGAACPWRGLVFVSGRPSLWPWLAAPVALFVVVVAPTAWWLWARFPVWVASVAPPPGVAVLAGLWLVAVLVLALVLFVGLAAAEWVVVSIVTRPAYALVAARVEAEVAAGGRPVDMATLLVDAAWSVVHSLLALGVYAALALALSVLALVPVAGEVVVPVVFSLLSALWLARELVDGPLSRRRLGFAAKLRFVAVHWPEMLALGVVTGLGLVVPVVDLVVLPAAFVGATLWAVGEEIEARGSGAHPRG